MLRDEALDTLLVVDPAPRVDFHDPSSLLARILRPRVPGTANHTYVREALVGVFANQTDAAGTPKWHIAAPTFEVDTPEGRKRMTNVVATRDPQASRRLVLAAHYDSKFAPPGPMEGFIGATDSAAPCAILADVAVALESLLDAHTAECRSWRAAHPGADRIEDVTLQIIFFDGEEAFHEWTHTDSVYGARHLADTLFHTWLAPAKLTARHVIGKSMPIRAIQQIENMVLLDLLGAADPQVPFYFESTKWLHTLFQRIERRLLQRNALWPAKDARKRNMIMDPRKGPLGIDDDHAPFLAQGVPVLHLIPFPFPRVWHTIEDDASALDYAIVHAWAKLVRVFTAEYLGLGTKLAKEAPPRT